MTPEQEQLLIQAVTRLEQGQEEFRQLVGRSIQRLEQGQEDLRRVVMETRGDMAQFTEWAGIVTQAIERQDQVLATLAAGQQQQQAILNELIRQRRGE